jgi:hypothetical protein
MSYYLSGSLPFRRRDGKKRSKSGPYFRGESSRAGAPIGVPMVMGALRCTSSAGNALWCGIPEIGGMNRQEVSDVNCHLDRTLTPNAMKGNG